MTAVRSILAIALLACPIACSCQDGGKAGHGSEPATGGANVGGSAGTGGGGSGGTAGAGTGGIGTGGTAGGVPLKWEGAGLEVFGCPVEKVAGPFPSLFEWSSCTGATRCESATWNSTIVRGEIGTEAGVSWASVDDGGTDTRAAFLITSEGTRFACVTNEAGVILMGVRLVGSCRIQRSTVRDGHFAFMVAKSDTEHEMSAILGALSEPALRVAALPVQAGIVPQWQTQNKTRVVWWWVPGDRLSSFAATDGSDFRFFASAAPSGPTVAVATPVGFPDGFLYEAVVAQEGGSAQRTVFLSNGLDPGSKLVPTQVGFDYAQAEYLHSHIAWLRGQNPLSTNVYESVELWAAAWTGGSLGTPQRVGAVDTLVDGTYRIIPPETGGAFGRYMLPFGDGTFGRVDIWDVTAGKYVRRPLPPETPALAPSGITRRHAYVTARGSSVGVRINTHFLRFATTD